MNAFLGAVELEDDSKDWAKSLADQLRRDDLQIADSRHQRANYLRVWDPSSTQRSCPDFVEGWEIQKCWLGPRRHALAVLPKRFYFKADGTIDSKPEREIINLNHRPRTPLNQRLAGIDRMLSILESRVGPRIRIDDLDENIEKDFHLLGRNGTSDLGAKLQDHHARNGFHDCEGTPSLAIISTTAASMHAVVDFSRRLESLTLERDISLDIRTSGQSKLEERLDEMEAGSQIKSRESAVLFMLGNKNEPASRETLRCMRRLDQLDIRYRRAYSNDPRNFSVQNQFPSILQALGIRPHGVGFSTGEELPWTIGVDLSHPREQEHSIMCVALIDPMGCLAHAWVSEHRRDETAARSILRPMLLAATEHAHQVESECGFLIVRDGRLFERENSDDYCKGLGGPVTLVEVRKRQNPLILCPGEPPSPPMHPAVASTDDSNSITHVRFLSSLSESEHGKINLPLKIRWDNHWDGLKLGEQIPQILHAQTRSPGLGLQPRTLPAPLYWADGIAGAGDNDLRFRGQAVTRI